jgi:hypothetical protein
MNRLAVAMIAYVVLGLLTWTTISDTKFRTATLVILGLFALKSWIKRNEVLHPDGESDAK